MKNIWIDTDPGLDDALAIIWAIQKEQDLGWKIHGISTVKGNLNLSQINGNAKALLTHLGRVDIPIYSGAYRALIQKPLDASYIHGTSLGPINVDPIETLGDRRAPEALADFLSKWEEKLTLVTLGPLTNIAIFILLYPELLSKIEQIVMMGGGSYGNVSYYAEFNMFVDPEAAYIVFESGIPIMMSGLDISDQYTYLYFRELDHYLKLARNTWTSEIFHYMAKVYKHNPDAFIPLYDPTAMIAAAFPELFETYKSPVTVEMQGQCRGMTLIPTHSTFRSSLPDYITTQVLKSCDRVMFLQALFEGL